MTFCHHCLFPCCISRRANTMSKENCTHAKNLGAGWLRPKVVQWDDNFPAGLSRLFPNGLTPLQKSGMTSVHLLYGGLTVIIPEIVISSAVWMGILIPFWKDLSTWFWKIPKHLTSNLDLTFHLSSPQCSWQTIGLYREQLCLFPFLWVSSMLYGYPLPNTAQLFMSECPAQGGICVRSLAKLILPTC